MGPDWCYSCGRNEPLPPHGAYLVCNECWHVYRTPGDLEETYRRKWNERVGSEPAPNLTKAADVYFCPLCLHDF